MSCSVKYVWVGNDIILVWLDASEMYHVCAKKSEKSHLGQHWNGKTIE